MLGMAPNGMMARMPNMANSLMGQMNGAPPNVWPYPSPPVSPTNAAYYAVLSQQQAAAHAQLIAQQQLQLQQQHIQQQMAQALQQQQVAPNNGPTVVLMRGLPPNASNSDVLTFFQGLVEVPADCVQIQRNTVGSPTGGLLYDLHKYSNF